MEPYLFPCLQVGGRHPIQLRLLDAQLNGGMPVIIRPSSNLTLSRITSTRTIYDTKTPLSTLMRQVGVGSDCKTYVVERGDTLAGVALRHGMTTSELKRLNHMFGVPRLMTGQMLLVRKKTARQHPSHPKADLGMLGHSSQSPLWVEFPSNVSGMQPRGVASVLEDLGVTGSGVSGQVEGVVEANGIETEQKVDGGMGVGVRGKEGEADVDEEIWFDEMPSVAKESVPVGVENTATGTDGSGISNLASNTLSRISSAAESLFYTPPEWGGGTASGQSPRASSISPTTGRWRGMWGQDKSASAVRLGATTMSEGGGERGEESPQRFRRGYSGRNTRRVLLSMVQHSFWGYRTQGKQEVRVEENVPAEIRRGEGGGEVQDRSAADSGDEVLESVKTRRGVMTESKPGSGVDMPMEKVEFGCEGAQKMDRGRDILRVPTHHSDPSLCDGEGVAEEVVAISSLGRERGAMSLSPATSPKPQDRQRQKLQVPGLVAGGSDIISLGTMGKLEAALPEHCRGYNWVMLYSTFRDGASHIQFYDRTKEESPTYIVVEAMNGEVFGGFASATWKISPKYYGTGESFLFRISGVRKLTNAGSDSVQTGTSALGDAVVSMTGAEETEKGETSEGWKGVVPSESEDGNIPSCGDRAMLEKGVVQSEGYGRGSGDLDRDRDLGGGEGHNVVKGGRRKIALLDGDVTSYVWSGMNTYFQYSTDNSLGMGGGGGNFGLFIGEDFMKGSTGMCRTFDNPPLCSKQEFEVCNIEIWGFTTADTETGARLERLRKILRGHTTRPLV